MRRIDLAERCAALGYGSKLSHGVIGHLETGRRGPDGTRRREVTVDEVVVLAAALDVSPLLLLLPIGRATDVELLPGERTPIGEALTWFMAAGPSEASGRLLMMSGSPTDRSAAYLEAIAPALRLLAHEQWMRRGMLAFVATVPHGRTEEEIRQAQADLREARRELGRVRDLMRAAGDVLPVIPLPGLLREAPDA